MKTSFEFTHNQLCVLAATDLEKILLRTYITKSFVGFRCLRVYILNRSKSRRYEIESSKQLTIIIFFIGKHK